LFGIVWSEVGHVQPQSERVRLFFLFFLVGLSGCHREPVASPGRPEPFRGLTVRVLCPGPTPVHPATLPQTTNPKALIDAYAPAWANRHAAKVDVELYDPRNKLPEGADIWVLPPAALPHAAAAGKLLPLPETFTLSESAFAWQDLLPEYKGQLLTWRDAHYGAPLAGEAPLSCYRVDRLTQYQVTNISLAALRTAGVPEAVAAKLEAWTSRRPEHRDLFLQHLGETLSQDERARWQRDVLDKAERSLPALDTWEQCATIAETFRDFDHAPSLSPLPADDAALDRLFWTVAANYARRAVPKDEDQGPTFRDDVFGLYYDLKTGEGRLTSPGIVEALKMLQRLQACRPEKAAGVPEEAFLDGRAVLCITDACWLAEMQKKADLRDRVGFCRVPGSSLWFNSKGEKQVTTVPNRVPYLGGAGWVAAVPKSAPHPAAAFELLADLAGPRTGGQIILAPRWGSGPTRQEQLRNDRWDPYNLDANNARRFREVLQETLLHTHLRNPLICLRTPTALQHRAALDTQVRRALQEKGVTAEQALTDARKAWEKLDGPEGVKASLADYCVSLGLPSP
jgi:ABC-type glycerol-3-phosphate transport system substrate-binding protein